MSPVATQIPQASPIKHVSAQTSTAALKLLFHVESRGSSFISTELCLDG